MTDNCRAVGDVCGKVISDLTQKRTFQLFLFFSKCCVATYWYLKVVKHKWILVKLFCFSHTGTEFKLKAADTHTHTRPPFPVCFFIALHHLKLTRFVWTMIKNVVSAGCRLNTCFSFSRSSFRSQKLWKWRPRCESCVFYRNWSCSKVSL